MGELPDRPDRLQAIGNSSFYQSRLRRPSRNDLSVYFAVTACSPGPAAIASRTAVALSGAHPKLWLAAMDSGRALLGNKLLAPRHGSRLSVLNAAG